MLTYAATLLIVPMILGQTDPSRSPQDLTQHAAFIGNWEAKDVVVAGETCHAPVSWQYVLDGTFIEHRYVVFNAQEKPIVWGIVMIGLDPSTQETNLWGFQSDGACSKSKLTQCDGKCFAWDSTLVKADGTQQINEIAFDIVAADRYKWNISSDNGEKNEAVFVRVPGTSLDVWPQNSARPWTDTSDSLGAIASWTGDYLTEGTTALAGKPFVGQAKSGWTLEGRFLLFDTATVDSELVASHYRAILGVDPTTRKISGWEFDGTGFVGKYTVTENGQSLVGKAIGPKQAAIEYSATTTNTPTGMKYEVTGQLSDGKRVTYGGTWRRK